MPLAPLFRLGTVKKRTTSTVDCTALVSASRTLRCACTHMPAQNVCVCVTSRVGGVNTHSNEPQLSWHLSAACACALPKCHMICLFHVQGLPSMCTSPRGLPAVQVILAATAMDGSCVRWALFAIDHDVERAVFAPCTKTGVSQRTSVHWR